MSVSVGGSTFHPAVLMELLGSDQSVHERIQRFESVKADAQNALAELNLGKDARAAYDEARIDRQQATAILERAKEEADLARTRLADADATLTKAQADAAKIRADADAYAARAIAAADTLQGQAQKQHDDLERASANARSAEEAAHEAKAKATEAERVAKFSHAKSEERAARLEAALQAMESSVSKRTHS